MNASHISTLKLNTLVWLNVNSNSSESNYRFAQILKSAHSHLELETYDDIDKCIDYISECQGRTFALILNGQSIQYIVQCAHDISQLKSIYIECALENVARHQLWSKDYEKIKGFATTPHDLANVIMNNLMKENQYQESLLHSQH
ncbi:unnamed protein product, partial [Adineta ricciae]